MTRKMIFAAVLAALAAEANAALTTGDLAFTSFNADEDGWSLVTFKDIEPNTIIYFTDNEATSATGFNTGESAHQWSTGGNTISAGTVVRFSAIDKSSRSASIGNFSVVVNTNPGISSDNETIYAYFGTDVNTPTTFLAGVSSEGATNLTPAGLTGDVNAAILTNSTDYAQYTGVRSGLSSFDGYRTLVNNPANWNIIVGGSQELQVPNTTAFTVVPVPAALPLFLSALAAIGSLRRRG